MSKIELLAKIELLNKYEAMVEELKAQADTIRNEIKAEMDARELEEMIAGQYIVRYTAVREKRLRLVIVGSMTLDCREGRSDPMSEAFLQMAGVFSQLELAMIRSRVRSGMANAKAKGKQIGRPQRTAESIPAIFLRHYPAYKKGQLNVSELARVCDLSRTTVYKYIELLER